MRKKIVQFTIQVVHGDISDQEVDAVVNAANSDLWMGSGVAEAIKRKGGQSIEQEAMSQGPINPGEAVMTSGGQLTVSCVIHCARMPPSGSATEQYVKSSFRHALKLDEDNNVGSIEFPTIGAGVGGLCLEDSILAIMSGIRPSIRDNTRSHDIRLVAYSADVFEQMKRIIDELEDLLLGVEL